MPYPELGGCINHEAMLSENHGYIFALACRALLPLEHYVETLLVVYVWSRLHCPQPNDWQWPVVVDHDWY